MKKEIVLTLTENFELHAQKTENGVEYWLARDLQSLFGYDPMEELCPSSLKSRLTNDCRG